MKKLTDCPFNADDIVIVNSIGDITWVAAYSGLFGSVNGYVRLNDDHPWLQIEDETEIPSQDITGGITFRHENWIGFDTLHINQFWPGGPIPRSEWSTDMTKEIVISWTENLSDQAVLALF